jgi:2,5-furandicarboxylate decarboxylase 1
MTVVQARQVPAASNVDTERFRLRHFIDELIAAGDVDIHDEAQPLGKMGQFLDGNPKAVLFRNAGPEKAQVVGNVLGSRERIARAFGVGPRELLKTVRGRLATPIGPVEIPNAAAPVQQVVWRGDDADFTRLPVHLQHSLDGAPYISATIDVSRDPVQGNVNVGIRRLMLRGRREAGIDLNAPSDLRAIYSGAVNRGEKLPLSIVVGAHPVDFIGAMCLTTAQDELATIGALRESPVPVVKCVTNDLKVPADAEIVLEGYLDPKGWTQPEGPYGEYLGYYGKLKNNPVFHLTAITMRKDALFQTATIGGRYLARTDTAQIAVVATELAVWASLESAIREPVAVYVTAEAGGMYNCRLSLKQRVPGEARNAIAAVLGSHANVKNVFVMDDDIDVFSHDQVDWALATRFQPDRDLVVSKGYRAVPLDPSLEGSRVGAKAGFDLTVPFGKGGTMEFVIPEAPQYNPAEKMKVADALKKGPKTYRELMEVSGSLDGRDVLLELEPLYADGTLRRLEDGRYTLAGAEGTAAKR